MNHSGSSVSGGGGAPAPDWKAKLPDALKTKVPQDADGYITDNGIVIFTKQGEALENGKFNADGSKYDPTKSNNANPEVRNPSGTSGSGNSGRAGGSSSVDLGAFGFGFSNNTSGDIGASFMNAGYTIDAEKFMGASMGFGAMSSLAQMMPFGLGAVFANNTLGATLNNFMKSVSFNFDFSNMKTRAEQEAEVAQDNEGATAGTETGSGSGQTVAELAKARGYTPTDTQGVYQNNGKFFKYDEKTKEFVECKADGSALGTAEAPATPSTPSTPSTPPTPATPAKPETPATPSTPSTKAKTKTKPKTNPQQKPQAKSEAQLAKEQGFVRLDNGKYRQSKTGHVYEYKNGQFVYFADQSFKGGQFIRNKKIYNANGTPSTTTIAFGNSPSMYTLTAYLNDKNEYTQSYYNGLTLLTTKDGTITRYFDSAGRLVQTNEKVKAGFTRDPKNVVTRYTYGDRTGAVSKKETTNILTNTTVTTEYNLSGLKAGKTTKKGPVMTEQQMDGQGRTSTFRYQAITTVEVVNDRGKQKRITTVVKQQVR